MLLRGDASGRQTRGTGLAMWNQSAGAAGDQSGEVTRVRAARVAHEDQHGGSVDSARWGEAEA
jgi:hypothetical protein